MIGFVIGWTQQRVIDWTAPALMLFTSTYVLAVTLFLVFCFIFPELPWVPVSLHYCVCFLLPGPTYRLVKSEVTQQLLE